MDSKLFTLHTIETLWNKIKNKCYIKPINGIPKSDLDTTVQSSLDKADSALQKHQDISGKQDKSTAVTHTANMAVGSAIKPIYIAENGTATPISHSINSDVPANAKFTDTTYSDATESTHGLMNAEDKAKLDSLDESSWLPKTGGVMTGNIDMLTNKAEILVDAGRVISENGNNTLPACGELSIGSNTIQEYLPRTRSFFGSYKDANSKTSSIISIRHRNGDNAGRHFGMYLRHEAKRNNNLVWNNQLGTNTWEGERTILDSKNYTDYIPNSAAAVSVEENSTEFGLIFTLPSSSVGVISTGYGVIVAGSIASVGASITVSDSALSSFSATINSQYSEIFAPRNDVTSIQVCISSTGTKSLVYCVQNANKITFEKIDGSNFASSDIIEYASPVYILNTPYTS